MNIHNVAKKEWRYFNIAMIEQNIALFEKCIIIMNKDSKPLKITERMYGIIKREKNKEMQVIKRA